MKAIFIGVLTTILFIIGCKHEQTTAPEPILKQPLSGGGYIAYQLAEENWPGAIYQYAVRPMFGAVRDGGKYGFSIYTELRDNGLLRQQFNINAIPLKVGKILFPTYQQVVDGYSLDQALPIARYLIQDDDEPRAGYILDDKAQNVLEIYAIDTQKNYVKGRLDLHFVFSGTDANWEEAQRIDSEAKYRTFVLAGDFEIGKP